MKAMTKRGDCSAKRAALKDFPVFLLGNRKETETLYVMTLRAPELAEMLLPGQFVHMEIPTLRDHILRRPFSVYDTDSENGTIDILYQVVGDGTADMAKWQAGYLTNVIGPIGNTWTPAEDVQRALLVGGGVGAAPLFMLYRQLVEGGSQVDVVLGAQTADALVCKGRYADVCGDEPHCSTDDGTYGRKGFCTVLAEEAIARAAEDGAPYDYVAVCGPEPLMRAVAGIALSANIPVQVSLEKRMACGVGACLSCVVDTTSGKKRACVDGPIFDASEVVW